MNSDVSYTFSFSFCTGVWLLNQPCVRVVEKGKYVLSVVLNATPYTVHSAVYILLLVL